MITAIERFEINLELLESDLIPRGLRIAERAGQTLFRDENGGQNFIVVERIQNPDPQREEKFRIDVSGNESKEELLQKLGTWI